MNTKIIISELSMLKDISYYLYEDEDALLDAAEDSSLYYRGRWREIDCAGYYILVSPYMVIHMEADNEKKIKRIFFFETAKEAAAYIRDWFPTGEVLHLLTYNGQIFEKADYNIGFCKVGAAMTTGCFDMQAAEERMKTGIPKKLIESKNVIAQKDYKDPAKIFFAEVPGHWEVSYYTPSGGFVKEVYWLTASQSLTERVAKRLFKSHRHVCAVIRNEWMKIKVYISEEERELLNVWEIEEDEISVENTEDALPRDRYYDLPFNREGIFHNREIADSKYQDYKKALIFEFCREEM